MTKALIALNKTPSANCLENSCLADGMATPLPFRLAALPFQKRGGHPLDATPTAPASEAKGYFQNGIGRS